MTLTKKLHDALIDTGSLLCIAAAGAGATFIRDLMLVPGCSQYLDRVEMPYGQKAVEACIGHPLASFCSESTALELAMEAYISACNSRCARKKTELCPNPFDTKNPVGIGISAAIATDRVLKGGNRVHVGIITKDVAVHGYLNLYTGAGVTDREEHDLQLSYFIRGMLLKVLTDPHDLPEEYRDVTNDCFDLLMDNPVFEARPRRFTGTEHRVLGVNGLPGLVYLPATLNPLHEGHRRMASAADSFPGQTIYLVELESAHKGRMPLQQALNAVGQVRTEEMPRDIEFSRGEALFIDKARARPGCTFVIGADAMQRMMDPKWGPEVETMLNEMRNLCTKFLVMGRMIDGKWTTCRDIHVPWPFQLMFTPIEGRVDLSSTEIRNANH